MTEDNATTIKSPRELKDHVIVVVSFVMMIYNFIVYILSIVANCLPGHISNQLFNGQCLIPQNGVYYAINLLVWAGVMLGTIVGWDVVCAKAWDKIKVVL